MPRWKKTKALKDAKWKASKAHDEKAKVVTDAKLELAAAKQRIIDDTAKVREIELTLATIEHEAEVARLASTEAQEVFQTFVDANKKQLAAKGGDAKPAEQQGGGGQMWPQPPAPMDFMTVLNAVNTEAVAIPTANTRQLLWRRCGRVAEATYEVRRCVSRLGAVTGQRMRSSLASLSRTAPNSSKIPRCPKTAFKPYFGEGLSKDDKTGPQEIRCSCHGPCETGSRRNRQDQDEQAEVGRQRQR